MGLARYHAKRDFKITPEPRGRIGAEKPKALSYVIQKHAATRLHYDFRLELNGVLLSWAVPKGPSLDPADKRLAMHVEDHPIEYGGFEGTIPKGQYGGGTVMLWDRGTWTPVGDAETGYKKGHLKFELDGEKLHGRWVLVRTGGSRYDGKDNAWLLIKDRDEFARSGASARVVESQPDSVASGRNLDEIAAGSKEVWHSSRSVAENLRAGAIAKVKSSARRTRAAGAVAARRTNASAVPGAKASALPAVLAPTLATLVASPPSGDDWIHEAKYDGYRMLARLEDGEARLYTRRGNDWTQTFTSIAREVARLKAKRAWLDGELCALDSAGNTSFQALQNALSGSAANLVYFIFDLLYLDGLDLRRAPLVERKRLLLQLLERSSTKLKYSPDVRGAGEQVFRQACAARIEGIVSKRTDSPYAAGSRTRDWQKVRCSRRQEMVIGGYTDPRGSRAGLGALLLGVYQDGKLRYAGKVGTGFDDETLVKMRRRLEKLEQREPPFSNPPRGYEAKGAHWVKPELVGEVSFTEWSDAGALRHPVFMGLRADKKATEVVRETPGDTRTPKDSTPRQALRHVAPEASIRKHSNRLDSGLRRNDKNGPAHSLSKASSAAAKTHVATPDGNTVAGVKLSHPDKQLFPEAGLTKLDIARYYEAIADWILPHVKDRPLSLVRCPDGWAKECFYQKHANPAVNEAVQRVRVPEGRGKSTYLAVNSLPGLIGLVQWGVIELHPWGSTMPHPELPDRLILDFDPADEVPWSRVVDAVKMAKTLLDKLGLQSFLKTTGGKGLHVVFPIEPTVTWTQAKQFTRSIAEMFVKAFPDRYTATMSKSKRTGRIFIDYLRNGEGATSIAPYGIRARANAPVSTPISWKELGEDVRFDHFNLRTVQARLRKLRKDPWADFDQSRRKITASMFEQVGLDSALLKRSSN